MYADAQLSADLLKEALPTSSITASAMMALSRVEYTLSRLRMIPGSSSSFSS